MTSDEEIKELLVEILEDLDTVAATTGVFRNDLMYEHGVELEFGEVRELLEELREEGVMEYQLGEFGEFALVEQG